MEDVESKIKEQLLSMLEKANQGVDNIPAVTRELMAEYATYVSVSAIGNIVTSAIAAVIFATLFFFAAKKAREVDTDSGFEFYLISSIVLGAVSAVSVLVFVIGFSTWLAQAITPIGYMIDKLLT